MKRRILFDDIDVFNVWNRSISVGQGYPNVKTKTVNYAPAMKSGMTNKIMSYTCCPLDGLTEISESDAIIMGFEKID